MEKKKDNRQTKKRKIADILKKKKKQVYLAILCIVAVVVCIFSVKIWKMAREKGEEKSFTSATLTATVSISELSAAKFIYNGIAEIYEDEEQSDIKCHIRYNATVKAGIDMKAITFDIDYKNKTIKPILPEIEISLNSVDEKTLSFIPDKKKADVDLQEALITCRNDVISEAKASPELFSSAKDNLKSIIEALLLPIITPKDYKIIWD